MENADEVKFNLNVPYNHPVSVQSRKKSYILGGVMMTIVAAAWAIVAVVAGMSESGSIGIALGFVAFSVLCLACGIYFFCIIKPLKRNDNKITNIYFYENYLDVKQTKETKQKTLTTCLYRPYKNKQYVSRIIELYNKIDVKVYTGTYNGAPKYALYTIPKDLLTEEQLNEFILFLKDRVGADYVVKANKN